MLKHVLEPVSTTSEGFSDAANLLEGIGLVVGQPWMAMDQKAAVLHVRSRRCVRMLFVVAIVV
jgi:hypothetical protein